LGNFSQRFTNDGNWGGDREKWFDLAGGFGSIRFGRFAPTVANFGGYGNNGTSNTVGHPIQFSLGGRTDAAGTGGSQQVFAGAGANSVGSYHRNNGTVQWTTPNINGFVATLSLGQSSVDLSDANQGKTKASQHGVTLNYAAGPLSVGAGHAKRKTETEAVAAVAPVVPAVGPPAVIGVLGSAAVANSTAKGDTSYVGGRYDFGAAAVTFAHAQREDSGGNVGAAQARSIDAKINSIGVTVPLGALTLMGSMYDGRDERTIEAGDERKMSGHQLSAHYALSKRTVIYAVTGKQDLKNRGGAAFQRKHTESNVGLRHSF